MSRYWKRLVLLVGVLLLVGGFSFYFHYRDRLPNLAGGSESKSRSTKHSPQHPVVYRHGSPDIKQVALTFDDGPDLVFTPQILDILKRYGVKATFFLMGSRAAMYPQVVARIAREGHAIGNHTFSHPKLFKMQPEQVREEVEQADQVLFSILGYHPKLFRPPYGAAPPMLLDELGAMGYPVIDWSVDTLDWSGVSTPLIISYVHSEVSPGGIILQHSAGDKTEDLSNTVRALPEIISWLQSEGYRIVTVPQLLNLPAYR